jgi:hypothetical protein
MVNSWTYPPTALLCTPSLRRQRVSEAPGRTCSLGILAMDTLAGPIGASQRAFPRPECPDRFPIQES